MFDEDDDVLQTRKDLCWLLEALTQRNQDYLKQRPDTPRLYKSGVRWVAPRQFGGECEEVAILRKACGRNARDPGVARVLRLVQEVLGGEHFCDIGVILELGGIDCDGIACWRAAELRQGGIAARPMMTNRKRGGGTIYHALVVWPPIPGVPYETSEDPSLLLGMGGADRAADRREEIAKDAERCDHLRAARGFLPGVPLLTDAGDAESALADVLGIPRGRRSIPGDAEAIAAVNDIMRRIAA